MAKIVFICFRDCKQNPYSRKEIEILSNRLMPDNISPTPPLMINNNGVLIGMFNPRRDVKNSLYAIDTINNFLIFSKEIKKFYR
ncbi:hypothetical protein ES702_00049 [subsurface metagenome]